MTILPHSLKNHNLIPTHFNLSDGKLNLPAHHKIFLQGEQEAKENKTHGSKRNSGLRYFPEGICHRI